jgi:transcriptional regulator with XRE-family HTH domain/tetratricopeptide (TPR) repeat protein
MGQQPNELTPGASPLHAWGAELRELRIGRGFSLRKLAVAALVDHSHLARFERAERTPDRSQVVRLDAALDANGSLLRLWVRLGLDVASKSHVANSAVHVAKSSVDLVLSLPEQAASDGEGLSVPCRLEDGSVVWMALDRRALLRGGVGLGAVAATSLGSSAVAVPRPRVTAAYGPTPVEHLQRTRRLLIDSDNLLGPRSLVTTVREHIEVIGGLRRDTQGEDRRSLMELQTQYGEFLSWLYQDLGDVAQAQHWLDRAFQWSHTVGDSELTAYVLARKAQLAGDMADVTEVVDLAEAAQRTAAPRSRLAAVARTFEGYGHALRGEASESERALDHVRNSLDMVASDPGPWGVWLNTAYVEVHRGQSLEALGKHEQAADAFAGAIRALPDGYHRDRGVYLARQAVSLAEARAPEEASAVGLQALSVAEDTGSGRIVNELTRLDQALAGWGSVSEAADFRITFASSPLHEIEA